MLSAEWDIACQHHQASQQPTRIQIINSPILQSSPQLSISLLSTLFAFYSTACVLRSTVSCITKEHATVMTSSSSPVFLHLWRNEGIRSVLLSHLDTSSKCALRLTAAECCDLTTQSLFARTRLTFTPSALTRPSRTLHTVPVHILFLMCSYWLVLLGLEALSRIGPSIESLVFSFPHTADTFLPPLLNPITGREVNFLYAPHTTAISVIQRPKYGSPELGDLLTQQYPPSKMSLTCCVYLC